MRRYFWLMMVVVGSCAPKQQIVFRKALNIRFEAVNKQPVLKADLVFFNPNKDNAKLKRIDMKILVEDKTAGIVDQTLNQKIMGNSEFSIPIEIKLNLKEMGLLDTLINLFGGKKYKVHMMGKVRVSVNGFAFSVPVDQEEELRIRM